MREFIWMIISWMNDIYQLFKRKEQPLLPRLRFNIYKGFLIVYELKASLNITSGDVFHVYKFGNNHD